MTLDSACVFEKRVAKYGKYFTKAQPLKEITAPSAVEKRIAALDTESRSLYTFA